MEQRWWNRRIWYDGTVEHVMVETWGNHGGTVEHLMVKQWNFCYGTVQYLIVEHWTRDGGKVKRSWWNSLASDIGTVEHLIVD